MLTFQTKWEGCQRRSLLFSPGSRSERFHYNESSRHKATHYQKNHQQFAFYFEFPSFMHTCSTPPASPVHTSPQTSWEPVPVGFERTSLLLSWQKGKPTLRNKYLCNSQSPFPQKIAGKVETKGQN